MPIDLAPHNPYSLTLGTPLIAAAGSLNYGIEVARLLGLGDPAFTHGLGAIVTRTTTLHPQRANPLPRIIETPAGLLYSGMHHNPGIHTVITRYAPIWATWKLPVIISIAGDNAACAATVAALEGVAGIAGVEINLAMPTLPTPEQARRMISAARTATLLPLLAKIPLVGVHDALALANAAAESGADAISLVGGGNGLAVDPQSGEPVSGWLCGPALRPLAMAMVSAVAQSVAIPIIGGGGIRCAADAQQFLAVGATAVGLGSILLSDFRHAARIAATLTPA